jgi:photosystem II stability/assembly factor-like uncharacterized protein
LVTLLTAGRYMAAWQRFGAVFRWLLLTLFVALLAACGGGGGGAPPDSASGSVKINTQPTDQSVIAGEAATFKVVVIGNAAYQWQRSSDGTNWQDVTDAKSASYTTPVASMADDDSRFRVVVTSVESASQRLISSSVTLTVTEGVVAPKIVQQPTALSLREGQQALFAITATGTALSYQWERANPSAPWAPIDGATAPYYELPSAQLADSGARFRVLVSNSEGRQTSQEVVLTVAPALAAPLFDGSPLDTSATAGTSVSFELAGLTGYPTPVVTWQTSRDGNTWTDVDGVTGLTLTIDSVQLADSGKQFRAVATNSSGSVYSSHATLTVTPAPVAPSITRQPSDQTIGTDVNASFSVAAAGTAPLTYQWQVSTDGGSRYVNILRADEATTNLHVSLDDDQNLYRAVVSNAAGSVTSSPARLTVLPAPEITVHPQNQGWRKGELAALFRVEAVGTDLRYQWQSSIDGGVTFTNIVGSTGASYVHGVNALPSINAVRVVVSNPVGSMESWPASIQSLDWAYVVPKPTGDHLSSAAWASADVVVAVGDTGTIVRSTDAGSTWRIVHERPPGEYGLSDIAFNGGSIGVAVGGMSGRIKRSIDSGAAWVDVRPDVLNAEETNAIAFASATTAVLTTTSGNLFRSTDAGLTWAAAVRSGSAAALRDIDFSANGVGLAVGANGAIFRTINSGAHWARVASGVTSDLSTVAFASPAAAVAAGADGTLLRSTDSGATWTTVASGAAGEIYRVDFFDETRGALLQAQGRIAVTNDGGVTWASANRPGESAFHYGVAAGANGIAVTVGFRGEILRSSDFGVNWTEVSNLPRATLNDIEFSTASVGLAVGGPGRIMRTTNLGVDWSSIESGTTETFFDVAFASAQTVLAVGSSGTIARSTDAGQSWASIDAGLWVSLHCVAFASSTVGLVGSDIGVWRTTDAGLSWTPVTGLETYSISNISFGSATTGVAFGFHNMAPVALRTVDGGLSWSEVAANVPVTMSSVRFASPSVVVAVGPYGWFLRSTDGGLTWSTGQFESYSDYLYNDVKFSSPTDGLAVGSFDTVFSTSDAGLTWTPVFSQKLGGFSAVAFADSKTAVAVGDDLIMRNPRYRR